MKRLRLVTLALLTQLACAALAEPSAGLQTSGYDAQVRVQDDLFRAVNGGWIQSTEIPADKSRFGSFELLRDQSDARVKALIDELAAKPQPAGSNAFKVATYFKSHLDVEAIEKAGLAPLQPTLDEIAGIDSPKALARWFGGAQMRSVAPIRSSDSSRMSVPRPVRMRSTPAGVCGSHSNETSPMVTVQPSVAPALMSASSTPIRASRSARKPTASSLSNSV